MREGRREVGGSEDMRAWTNDEKLKNAFQSYMYM